MLLKTIITELPCEKKFCDATVNNAVFQIRHIQVQNCLLWINYWHVNCVVHFIWT